MFTVDIKIDGEHYKKIAFAKPLNIKKILKENIENKENIITCKINNKFVNNTTIINSETILEGISRSTIAGDAIYKNTSIFILCKAFSSIFETDNKLVVEHSIGDGIYAEIINYTFSEKEINQISLEMQNIIDDEMPIEKVEVHHMKLKKYLLNKIVMISLNIILIAQLNYINVAISTII